SPVLGSMAVIVAPGSTARVESSTTPVRSAAVARVCARAGHGAPVARSDAASNGITNDGRTQSFRGAARRDATLRHPNAGSLRPPAQIQVYAFRTSTMSD